MSEESETKGELETETNMRRFKLVRHNDTSGVSGTGIVAEGMEFSSGKVVMSFRSHLGSVQVLDSIKVLKHTSVHKGDTKIVWIDAEPFESEEEQPTINDEETEEAEKPTRDTSE